MINNNTWWKLTDYLHTIIKLQITLHQAIVRIPQTLQNIFLFFGSLQAVTFLLRPNYYVSNQPHSQADIIYLQMYLSRPDLIVIDLLDFVQYQYYCLFPILLIIIMELIVLQVQAVTYLLRENKNQILQLQLAVNTSIGSILISLYSACSQLFLVYFKIPLYILIANQIITSSNDVNSGMLIVGIVTLIFIFMIDTFKLVICRVSYNTKIQGFEVVEDQKLDLIVQFFQLIQIAVYLFTTSQGATFIQGMLIIGISIINLYQTMITINYIKYEFIIIQIITQSIAITYVLCSIFSYPDLVLLISILLITLLHNYIKITLYHLFIGLEHIQKSNELKSLVVLYINSIIEHGSAFYQIQQSIVISKHRQKCSKINCFCKEETIYLPQRCFKKLILKKLNENNSQNQSKQADISDLLFYVASLHQLGFTFLAFQQVMSIVNGNQNNRKTQQWVKNIQKDALLSQSRTLKSNQSDSHRLGTQKKREISKLPISHRPLNQTSLEEARLSLLQSDISSQLKEDFMKKSKPSEIQISEAVNLFIYSELGQKTLKAQIISLLQQKIQFFQILLGAYTSTILYDKAKEVSQNFVKVEDDLIKQYEKFPSQKLQAVICFLQGELFNDYLKAFKYANFTTIADEKLINMRKNMKLNLFSNKITYINLKISDNLEALQIQSLSNNAHHFFGYPFEQFRKNQYLNFLIPDAVINEHGQMMTQFIQTGSNKFFRNQNMNFFKLQNQFVQPFSMLFDINNYVLDGINFAVFCELIDQAAAHILLDVSLIIGGISMNLFEKIGYRPKQITENSQIILECYNISIYEIIPHFDEVSKTNKKQYNMKLNLLDPIKWASSNNNISKLKNWQNNKNYINQYDATLSIHERQIYGLSYYIIEIDDIRQNVKQQQIKTKSKNNNIIEMPSTQQISDSFSDLPSINDSMNRVDIYVPLNIQKKMFSQQDNQALKELQYQEQQEYNRNRQILSPIQSPHQDQTALLNQAGDRFAIQQMFFNIEVLKDQNESLVVSENVKQQIEGKAYDVDRNMEQFIQNQLYQGKENNFIDDKGSQVSSLAGVRKSAYFKKYDVLDQTILRRKMPKSFKYCVSQIIVFILISSSYNMIIMQQNAIDLNRFIQYIDMLSFNQYFMAPYGMFTSSRLIWAQYPTDYFYKSFNLSVYNVILPWMQNTFGQQFAAMRTNFQIQFQNAYLQEFFNDDYLRVYYQETSPNNLSLVNITFKETLFQFLNYQYMYKIGYDQNRPIASMPMQTYSWINYFILTDHFESLTENILLYTQDAKDVIAQKWWIQQEFFNDDYLRVYYQETSPNNLSLVNITFKETLFQFLNYQYMYKIGYDQNRPIASMPMQTYSWINYFILTDHFESLTENILLYTQDAKDVIAQKWWIQSSVFISLTGIIMVIAYLFYLAFLTNYNGYLQMFSFADTQDILKDIERYKIFLSLLSKDSDVMFKYVFELDIKEQFLLTYQPIQKQVNLNHKITKRKQSDEKLKMPYLTSLISFTVIYALFFAFTFIITSQTQSYLQQYSQTIVFYKQLADLDTRVCGIYGDKLFANVILTFSFYSKSNLTDIQNRILQSASIMSNFSALAQNIDSSRYLFSSNFSHYFNSAKTGSICSLLSPADLAYAGQFCVIAFDGSLLLGLSNSLNYIINEVSTEYTVNQFKVRIIGSNTYSVQGAYILSRVLETLIQQLKASILISTNSQQAMVESFCISYLVYGFIFMILLSYFIIDYYSDEYHYTKRFALLIPSQTLLLNDNLERQLRIYLAKDAQ